METSFQKFIDFFRNHKENSNHLRWVFELGKGFKRYIFGFLILNLVSMVISLGSSVAGKFVVDAATNYSSQLFVKYIIIMLVTTVVTILLSLVSNMFSSYVGEKFSYSIRAKMFDRVQRSVWHKVSKYHSGDMLSRLTGDIDVISSGIISIVPNVIVASVQLIIILFILFKYDPTLAIIGLVIGPIGMLAALLYRQKYSHYQLKLRESQSEYYSFFQESLSNFSVIKTFQLEDENNERFNGIRKKRMKLIIKSTALSSVMGALMRLVYSIGYVAAFSWCAYRLTASGTQNPYTYGTMTLFLSLVAQVQTSIRSLGNIIPQLYSMVVCTKRIREITDIEDEDYTEIETSPKTVGLKMTDVSFSYDGDKVLDNINLEIKAKKHVGIVGSSGAGKTTFIRLLLSLVQPNSGKAEYILDDSISEVVCASSRRFISYVPQGNTLLSGSVRDNLRVGNKDATEEEMKKALDIAQAYDFVMSHPYKLDCVLSEHAGGVSEGQAQRIAIARALLRDKPVLILDEATSALDEATEARIFEKITTECDKTCFIITHRRSMLKYCDTIIEIDEDGHATVSDNYKEGE